MTTHSEFMPLTFRYKVSALDFIDKALGDLHFYERVKSAIEYTLEKMEVLLLMILLNSKHHYLVFKFHLIKFFISKHRLLCIRLLCIR